MFTNRFNNEIITVVLGTNTQGLDRSGKKYYSIEYAWHPQYLDDVIFNDIGLIKVHKDIVFGEKVQPIALPDKYFDKSNYSATLSGWGVESVRT